MHRNLPDAPFMNILVLISSKKTPAANFGVPDPASDPFWSCLNLTKNNCKKESRS